ncbi:MAG: hypothetical protein HYU53_10675 [Acidobacteria bacterium]|nr:hypothetical protein [Acidobacteriota bacterium]
MICSFCGLETGLPTSHETQAACIEALRSQVSELRNVLEHTRHPGDPEDPPHGLAQAAAIAGGDSGKAGTSH